MSDQATPDTDAYIYAIQEAKAAGHTVNIDFDNLPDGVDASKVAAAAGEGLPGAHQAALSDAADNGHAASINYGAILNSPYVKQAVGLGELAADPIGTSAEALIHPEDTAESALKTPLGQAALPAVGGAIGGMMTGGNPLGMGGGAMVGEGAKQLLDKSFAPELAPKSNTEAALSLAAQGVTPVAFEGAMSAAKSVYPWLAKMFTKLPLPVAKMFMENPDLPSQFVGSEESVGKAVGDVQQGLEALHQQASSLYGETLQKLGLAGPQTADEAAQALVNGEAKAVSPATIGQDWKNLQTNWTALDDTDKLQELSRLNQDINSNLKWAKAGQMVDPVSSKLSPLLNTVKTGVKQALTTVPGGSDLAQADETYHEFRQLYNSLQPNMADTGKATEWLTKVVSDPSAASATPKAMLSQLDQAVGSPVGDTAQKEIAANMLKKPMADTMLGKMMGLMAVIHPGRIESLPLVAAAQSPYMQTRGMQALMALKEASHGAPEVFPPAVSAGQQALSALKRATSPTIGSY